MISAQKAFCNETTIIDIPLFNLKAYQSSCHTCSIPKPNGFLFAFETIPHARSSNRRARYIGYSEGQVDGVYGFKINPETEVSVYVGAGIILPQIKVNDFFDSHTFSQVNVGISGLTTQYHRWQFQAGLNAQIDANKNVQNRFTEASRYSGLFWARYSLYTNFGMNLGLLVFTGIHQTTAYPLLGIDYHPNCHWNFNLVFPVYPSIAYCFNSTWSVAVRGRPFISRDRFSRSELVKNGIFEYRNVGTEIALDFNRNFLVWSIFGGYSYGGSAQIRNSKSKLIANIPFEGGGYGGGELLWRF